MAWQILTPLGIWGQAAICQWPFFYFLKNSSGWRHSRHFVKSEEALLRPQFWSKMIITSIPNCRSKLTPDVTFWRETSRLVVAQSKLDLWNQLDLRITNIYILLYHFVKKKENWIWEMTEYFDFGLLDLVSLFFLHSVTFSRLNVLIWNWYREK